MTVRGPRTQLLLMMAIQITHEQERATNILSLHGVSVKLCIFRLLAKVVTGAKKLRMFKTLYCGMTKEWWTDFTNLGCFEKTPSKDPKKRNKKKNHK